MESFFCVKYRLLFGFLWMEMLFWTFLKTTPELSQIAYILQGEEMKSEIRLEIIVISVTPCSSPLQEERYFLWPWTDPVPLMCILQEI